MQAETVDLVGDKVAGPGMMKLARTRKALAPRRRSRLAGWIWSASSGRSLFSAPFANSASIALSGRIPVVRVMRPSLASACGTGCPDARAAGNGLRDRAPATKPNSLD